MLARTHATSRKPRSSRPSQSQSARPSSQSSASCSQQAKRPSSQDLAPFHAPQRSHCSPDEPGHPSRAAGRHVDAAPDASPRSIRSPSEAGGGEGASVPPLASAQRSAEALAAGAREPAFPARVQREDRSPSATPRAAKSPGTPSRHGRGVGSAPTPPANARDASQSAPAAAAGVSGSTPRGVRGKAFADCDVARDASGSHGDGDLASESGNACAAAAADSASISASAPPSAPVEGLMELKGVLANLPARVRAAATAGTGGLASRRKRALPTAAAANPDAPSRPPARALPGAPVPSPRDAAGRTLRPPRRAPPPLPPPRARRAGHGECGDGDEDAPDEMESQVAGFSAPLTRSPTRLVPSLHLHLVRSPAYPLPRRLFPPQPFRFLDGLDASCPSQAISRGLWAVGEL